MLSPPRVLTNNLERKSPQLLAILRWVMELMRQSRENDYRVKTNHAHRGLMFWTCKTLSHKISFLFIGFYMFQNYIVVLT